MRHTTQDKTSQCPVSAPTGCVPRNGGCTSTVECGWLPYLLTPNRSSTSTGPEVSFCSSKYLINSSVVTSVDVSVTDLPSLTKNVLGKNRLVWSPDGLSGVVSMGTDNNHQPQGSACGTHVTRRWGMIFVDLKPSMLE